MENFVKKKTIRLIEPKLTFDRRLGIVDRQSFGLKMRNVFANWKLNMFKHTAY